jgi:hypothetical protein
MIDDGFSPEGSDPVTYLKSNGSKGRYLGLTHKILQVGENEVHMHASTAAAASKIMRFN